MSIVIVGYIFNLILSNLWGIPQTLLGAVGLENLYQPWLGLKETALIHQHRSLDAKLVDFAGYLMPVWYSNAKDEHLAVRNNVGMFDISHMGMIIFKRSMFNFLQKICTNDLNKTKNNKIIYTMILNANGGILDDVMVGFNVDLDGYFMIINAANKDKILDWFTANGLDLNDVEIRFDTHGLIAIQGPQTVDILSSAFGINWDTLGRFNSQIINFSGTKCIVMRTGYTGEDGIEISCPNEVISDMWTTLVKLGISPCGLAARDSLRIESALPLYGHELSELITPLQTRYQWVLALNTEFIGKGALKEQKDQPDNVTVGLLFNDRCLPRQGYSIDEGGVITSGTFSPVLDRPIAMAMIPKDIRDNHSTVTVDIRGRKISADLVTLPFLS